MSHNRIIAEFAKCGTLSRFSRRFHLLTREAKVKALEMIASGVEPGAAIRKAKKGDL